MIQDSRFPVRLRSQYPILLRSPTVDCVLRLRSMTGRFTGLPLVLRELCRPGTSDRDLDLFHALAGCPSLVGILTTLSSAMTLMLTIPRFFYVCCHVSCFSVLAACFEIMPPQRRRLTIFVTVARSFTVRPQDLICFPNQPNWSSGVNPCRLNRIFHLHLRTLPRTAAILTAQV